LPPLHGGEKAESFIEGIHKSSPPFEKGGREGFLGMPFQKAKLLPFFIEIQRSFAKR
jgi:hypothetical protein